MTVLPREFMSSHNFIILIPDLVFYYLMTLSVEGLSSIFPVYSSFNTSFATAWIVSNLNTDSIHRFFDSSPFSPSNRYIAYTEISISDESNGREKGRDLRERKYIDFATIVLMDLRSGERTEVGKTLAWDSQVGAHVQWGNSDSVLYYNSFGENLPYDSSFYCYRKSMDNRSTRNHTWTLPVGVAYNTYNGEKTVKNCPIYHISPDGKHSASPNLFKIGLTQKGYGIPLEKIVQRHKGCAIPPAVVKSLAESSSAADGLYLCKLHTSFCSVDVLLHKLATLADIAATTPMVGFHTKWSPDSQLVMFVVRTLEKPAPSRSWFTSTPKHVRVQHLFVVRPESGQVKHVVSWSSKMFLSGVTKKAVSLRDGNHPNWIPCTLLKDSSRCSTYKISMNRRAAMSKRKEPPSFDIVEYDVTHYFAASESGLFGTNATITQEKVKHKRMYHVGTGHPNYHYNVRYVVTDAYEKEREVLEWAQSGRYRNRSGSIKGQYVNGPPGEVPLRLIDLKEKREVTLLTMNIARRRSGAPQSMVEGVSSWFSSQKKDTSWRCDMHPAWSRDYQWLAINGVPNGSHRQVIIVHVGTNISNLF